MLAACWFSNLPLAVIATYLLAGVALLAALVRRTWAPVLRAALATPLGLGLAAIYWLPAAMERHWVDIRQATEDPGYNFENNWLFARHANPLLALHDVVLRQASWVAVSMIAVAVAGILIGWLRGTLPAQKSTGQESTDQKSTESTRWWIPLAAIPIVAFFLMFPISRPVWNLLPEMHFLQYPWRLLEAVEAPMAIFFVAAVWQTGRRARAVVVVACGAWFLAATVFAGTYFFQVCDDEDAVAPMLSAYHAGAGFEGMYEYEPPGGDDSSIATGLPDACLVSDPSAVLGKADPDNPDSNPVWSAGENSCEATFTTVNGACAPIPSIRMTIRGTIPHSGYLVLRLLSYPAWRVRVNGQLVTDIAQTRRRLDRRAGSAGPGRTDRGLGQLSRRGGRALAERRQRARAHSVLFIQTKAQRFSSNMKEMVADVKSLIQEGAELTDRALEELIPSVETVPASIHGAMRHSVFAGGKRLRPVLAMQAGVTIAGSLPKGIERLGAALEMLHTYSLIHDDLPALDNDDLRRGKPTCHVAFGEAIAILAGDALQTRAFEVLAGLACPPAATVRDYRPHRQRRRHRGGHDRRPGAGPRKRTPEAHAGAGRSHPSRQDRRADPR